MTTTPQDSRELNLVTWPYATHEGTGEGGLFAYAVWPLKEMFDSPSGPVLDSFPQLTSADVLTGAKGADTELFERAQRRIMDIRHSNDLKDVELAEYREFPRVPVAIFLGGTDSALFEHLYGEYFAVSRDDLTPQGDQLVTALEAIYGPATFLTFLDT